MDAVSICTILCIDEHLNMKTSTKEAYQKRQRALEYIFSLKVREKFYANVIQIVQILLRTQRNIKKKLSKDCRCINNLNYLKIYLI